MPYLSWYCRTPRRNKLLERRCERFRPEGEARPATAKKPLLPAATTRCYTCFMPPIVEPLTSVQFMLSSSFSSTSPTEQTLSPRTRYSPSGPSEEGSSSSGVRISRSTAPLRTCPIRQSVCVLIASLPVQKLTRFVLLSAAARVPTRIRESAVTMRTFSAQSIQGQLPSVASSSKRIDLLLRYPPRVAMVTDIPSLRVGHELELDGERRSWLGGG